jgi:hypothetical protein
MLICSLSAIATNSSVFLILKTYMDGKLVVKTAHLPGKVILWGMLISGMSFCTSLQTAPLSPVAQGLRLFTNACFACTVVLAVVLRLTTEHKPEDVNLR